MSRELRLQPGTTHVSVGDLPVLIAIALTPEPPYTTTVSSLAKAPRAGAIRAHKVDYLSTEDWGLFNRACSELPPYRDGISEAEWQVYAAAFERNAADAKWQPVPMLNSESRNFGMFKAETISLHRIALEEAIRSEKLQTRSPSMTLLALDQRTLPSASKVRTARLSL